MDIPLSGGFRAPIERLVRGVLKHLICKGGTDGPSQGTLPLGRVGSARVLPPYLSEMGMEIRYHVARVEPWLRNGWKVVSRRPALYPAGTTVDAPEFFAKADELFEQFDVHRSRGGILIPPGKSDFTITDISTSNQAVDLHLRVECLQKLMGEAVVEIALRKLFLEWFHADNRWINEYDYMATSFAPVSDGNYEYTLATAMRPGFLPPTFEHPQEPVEPHVGVQLRNVRHHECAESAYRNSDVHWMLETADALSRHLGLPVLVYGHADGCYIPDGYKTTWNQARRQGHMARELGYLKSCRLMLAPDSGWVDLMAWLEVPTLIERLRRPGTYTCLCPNFRPRLRLVDRERPIEPQADELLRTEGPVLPNDAPPDDHIDPRFYPWEP